MCLVLCELFSYFLKITSSRVIFPFILYTALKCKNIFFQFILTQVKKSSTLICWATICVTNHCEMKSKFRADSSETDPKLILM